jgi:hypothetical protein
VFDNVRVLPALVSLLFASGPGDRVFAKAGALVLREPADAAPPVRGLLPGDELIWVELSDDDLVHHKSPAGWIPVQTVDVPSQRSFHGWVAARSVGDEPLAPEKRIAILHQALDEALTEIAARQKPFADLRGQVLAWREKAKTDASAGAEVQRLANQLARYMETEVTPRALDIQDALEELRSLQDPKLDPIAARFGKLAKSFQP